MPTTLLVKGIWPLITKLCKCGRAYVAVAYLGKSGRKLLPLCAGSVLVVDASEGAVKQGQTNPAELMKFVRAGVDVHSAADLHAKVFAFPEAVLIGSTNVSQNSAKHWQEAASLSTDRRLIKAAREFVLDLAGEALPLARLKQLAKLYKPPKGGPKLKRSGRSEHKLVTSPERSRLWVAGLTQDAWDEEDHLQANRARPAAQTQLKRGETLDEFLWPGRRVLSLERGDQVVQVVEDGNRTGVYPVGTVVAKRAYRVERKSVRTVVFLALPDGRRSIALPRAKQHLGAHGKELSADCGLRLVRDRTTAQAIRQLWRPR